MKFVKKSKPVTKKIWKLVKYLPSPLRKRIIRDQFEINYKLPSEYVFKLAETEDEIEQALNIVYESYSLLGYIDDRPEKLHFNTYLCLPTTSILVLKHKDEVVGTMSIVPDSSFGLPSEVTWDLSAIKSKSMRIAEISSLSIKKSHKSSKGHLLLTLCKLMYEYCVKVLELDGIIIAATLEVEPFYTDFLLFSKVVGKTGQEHKSVKGNKSTCCFLNFHKAKEQYAKEYGLNKRKKNLYYFFTGFKSPNIRLPMEKLSIHGVLYNKNMAMLNVLEKFPSLKDRFTTTDKLKLSNMDPTFHIENILKLDKDLSSRIYPRISIKKQNALLFHPSSKRHLMSQLTDISSNGFGIKCIESQVKLERGDKCVLLLNTPTDVLSIHAVLQWQSDSQSGYLIEEGSVQDWLGFVKQVFDEINLSIDHKRDPQKKTA